MSIMRTSALLLLIVIVSVSASESINQTISQRAGASTGAKDRSCLQTDMTIDDFVRGLNGAPGIPGPAGAQGPPGEACDCKKYDVINEGENGYLGCWKDANDHDLPRYAIVNIPNMTIEQCINTCSTQGYKYAGLQHVSNCYCGQTYGKHGKAPELECGMRCSGDWSTFCGANWRNSIYRTPRAERGARENLGCWRDSADRDMPDLTHMGPSNTVSKCINLCYQRGFEFAGLQNGDWCSCGHTYGRLGRLDDSQCYMSCPGDHRLKCGGPWRNQIYRTDYGET